MKPTLEEENEQVFHLNQSLIGVISPNFRWISLEPRDDGSFAIHFLLWSENVRDRKAIEDAMRRYVERQSSELAYSYDVILDPSPLDDVMPPGRGVFCMQVDDN